MDRILAHWSAGTYNIGRLEKEHYHRIIDGDGKVHEGDHSISDNLSTNDGDYAAHTRRCNTGSIGVSIACMADAKEGHRHGKYPMKEIQFEALCEEMARLCILYEIHISSLTTLSHAEVHSNLGIAQSGKWDFTELSFKPELKGARECGDFMRQRIRHYMTYEPLTQVVENTQEFLNTMGAELVVDGDWGPMSNIAWSDHRSRL